jgi:hypothetical protein
MGLFNLFSRAGRCGFEPPDQKKLEAARAALVPSATPLPLLYHGAHSSEAQAIYEKLPARGKTIQCLGLELVDGWSFERRILKGRWLGMYDWQARAFALNWSPLTLVHEYGHHIQIHSLTSTEWRDWEAFWKANKAQMPNDYARTRASEGWAECFAFAYVRPEGIKRAVAEKVRGYFE